MPAAGGADAVLILADRPAARSPPTRSRTVCGAPPRRDHDPPHRRRSWPTGTGRGTNALLLASTGRRSTFAFGGGSRDAHGRGCGRAGATVVELDGPLAMDLDTPDDLLLVDRPPGALGVG